MKVPPRLNPGDKVAIISPSSGTASIFPWVYELGLQRIRDVFFLDPVEFPTARQTPEYLQKNPKARADDINAAFEDDSIKAIIATIGGNDQIRILPFLDADVIASHPKAFLGYSDNTNLQLFLWNLGLVSYYGGSVMCQFGMQGEMHDYTIRSITKALFEPAIGTIEAPAEWTDDDLDWADNGNLAKKRPLYKHEGWQWHNPKKSIIQGTLWGGCLEVVELHLMTKKYLLDLECPTDLILYLETSEEMPSEGFVYRFFAALGELNILNRFKAILIGRPKSQFCGKQPPEGKQQYVINQQNAVKKALEDYHADPLVIFNMNFGHTDPQIIIPNGGQVIIDSSNKTITFP